jgi:hypothetical protein
MAFVTAQLRNLVGSPPGRALYRYDTTDDYSTVDTANYFNNLTNDQNLAVGDYILVTHWSTAIFTGLINQVSWFVVTNVIANTAAANAGAVNVAQVILQSGVVSSID